METSRIEMTADQAAEALEQYRSNLKNATPEDERIMRAYREISKGKTLIRAYESIRAAAFDEEGMPTLAIARADDREITCRVWSNRVDFEPSPAGWRHGISIHWPQPADGDHRATQAFRSRAVVPMIPLGVRPKQTALKSYHILWEADWHEAPVDPMLLKRLQGDLWVVCAAWDLTPVERAVLSGAF